MANVPTFGFLTLAGKLPRNFIMLKRAEKESLLYGPVSIDSTDLRFLAIQACFGIYSIILLNT